jgi:tetratricopeptide (TPR) repeat protein
MRTTVGVLFYLLIYALANLAGWMVTFAVASAGVDVHPDGLDDAGPRYALDEPVPGTGHFIAGVAAWSRHDHASARSIFQALVSRQPGSPLVPACRAYLAELQMADAADMLTISKALQAYDALIADFPGTPNAVRAQWRIGDLHLALGSAQSAQRAYEAVLRQNPQPADRDRARLGLAHAAGLSSHWQEAEKMFRQVRADAADERTRAWATLGIGDSLAAQKQFQQAAAFYDEMARSWPDLLRQRPDSLARAAGTAEALGQEAVSRQIYLILHNVYPRRPDAAALLIKVGDSHRRERDLQRAKFFYAQAGAASAGDSDRALAQVRLADLGAELQAVAHGREVSWSVDAMTRQQEPLLASPEAQRRTLEDVAARHTAEPLGSEALYRLGVHRELRGEETAALQAYEQVFARKGELLDDPWQRTAGTRFRNLFEKRMASVDPRDAVAVVTAFRPFAGHADTVLQHHPALLTVAGAHQRLGLTAAALRLQLNLVSAPQSAPFREEAMAGLASSYMAQRDFAAARAVLERARLEYPVGPAQDRVVRMLIDVFDRLGQPAPAIRTCRQWLKRFPRHAARAEVWWMLVTMLARAGDMDGSLRAYAEAERDGALTDAGSVLRHADMLREHGRLDDAFARYARVARAAPDAAQRERAALQLARIWRERRQLPQTRDAWTELGRTASDGLVKRVALVLQQEMAGQGGAHEQPRRSR